MYIAKPTQEARHRVLRTLAIGDTLLWASQSLALFFLRYGPFTQLGWGDPLHDGDFLHYAPFLLSSIGLFPVCALWAGCYADSVLLRRRNLILPLVKALVLWTIGAFALIGVLNLQPDISRGYLLMVLVSGLILLWGWRLLFHRIITRQNGQLKFRVAFLGWNIAFETLEDALVHSRIYTCLGWISTKKTKANTSLLPLMGTLPHLAKILQASHLDVLFVSSDLDPQTREQVQSLCARCYIQLAVVPQGYFVAQKFFAQTVKGQLFLQTGIHPLCSMAARTVKRAMDIAGSLVGLGIFLPLLPLFALLIKRDSKGPVFYGHTRIGQYGKPFTIWKLRSMKTDAEYAGAQWALEDDPRKTAIGAFLRKWNLDELPQFWNVLKGDMSLVGPRPERPEFTSMFEFSIDGYNPRHSVRPGMSGWAQVNGLRGNTDLQERIKFDLHYIENWSVWLDVNILILTFMRRENAY